jgi:hypothetical protein
MGAARPHAGGDAGCAGAESSAEPNAVRVSCPLSFAAATQIDLGEAAPRQVISGLCNFVPLEQMQVLGVTEARADAAEA